MRDQSLPCPRPMRWNHAGFFVHRPTLCFAKNSRHSFCYGKDLSLGLSSMLVGLFRNDPQLDTVAVEPLQALRLGWSEVNCSQKNGQHNNSQRPRNNFLHIPPPTFPKNDISTFCNRFRNDRSAGSCRYRCRSAQHPFSGAYRRQTRLYGRLTS
jgi:hypothetical protein